MMKHPDLNWYKKIWTLAIKDMSWVEETEKQVSFLINVLQLKGDERILDLACGYGRHSIALAKKGFKLVGVDITKEYIEDARKSAKKERLDISFICSDIRDVHFNSEFDVVLNCADGAIGYLENERENVKIFDIIASSLKPGGKHFMDICNAEYAEKHFPRRNWEIGKRSVSLSEFEWDSETRRMLYGGWNIKFGEIAVNPGSVNAHSCARLYSLPEITTIFHDRGIEVMKTYSNYDFGEVSEDELQLMIISKKLESGK